MARAGIIILIVIALVLLGGSLFTVHETEQAIITQFGDPVSKPIKDAGFYFKLPFIQDVRRFEKRILEWDGEPNDIVTKDKKTINVDTTARWKIVDPLAFLRAVNDETRAQSRLDGILDGATREFISKNNLIEAVRASNRAFASDEIVSVELEGDQGEEDRIQVGRDKLIAAILANAQANVKEFGIELVDFRIRRIDYSEKVRKAVHDRMIQERSQIAEQYRSEGLGKMSEIEGRKELDLKRIESEAIRRSEVIRGEADAEVTRIYAEAYGADPEFYAFYQTLETYKNALAGEDTTLVLSTRSKLMKYLKDPDPEK
ncbi:MAG: protease modulator HflC [Planctomycetota bacterium]